jgi:F-type H+-transporting ATPase subunit gamma
MPSLRDIKRRIVSVKKTRQITRAMRMVAAAKLRRAQDKILSARPYSDRMFEAVRSVVEANSDLEHPLLVRRDRIEKVDLLVITSDRGLAGAFNTNVLKHAQRILEDREAAGASVALTLIGRKAGEYFRRRRPKQIDQYDIFGEALYERAVGLAKRAAERFVSGASHEVMIVYSEFVSTLSQQPRDVRLLPRERHETTGGSSRAPFSFEPSAEALLASLLPKTLEVAIYRAMLETQAGEHAARMTAMESATRNGEEMIESLTLRYNRARQAAITRELVEIISGAEAL